MSKKKFIASEGFYYLNATKSSGKFGYLFQDMLQAESFKRLSLGARYFYVLCRVHAKTAESYNSLKKHAESEGRETDYPEHFFVFPAKQIESYGYSRQNGGRYIKELVKGGFLDIAEQNKHRRQVNVLRFSDRWKSM